MALDYVPPNARLARELEQVAKESEQVSEVMRGVNLMPQAFPTEALEEICVSLSALKDGTAEGCNEPLNYARHMLPLVRRDHFYIEGDEPEISDDEDTYFMRDHPLDHAITRLYIAVGTALDEYRAQAQDKYDDHVGGDETIEFGQDGSFAEIDRSSQQLTATAEEERRKLSEWVEPSSSLAENLLRQLQDSANIAHSVLSQIRIKPTVNRWYEASGKALSKLPDVIVRTAALIRVGTDLGQVWLEEWSAFKRRVRHLAYDQIRGLADALEQTAVSLRRRRPANISVERQQDPDIEAAEKEIKRLLLAGAELPDELATKVRSLVFRKGDGKIKRSGDLILLRNLEGLRLNRSFADFQQISFVGQLPKLKRLKLFANLETDLSPLKELKNLTNLYLQANRADDLSPLGELKNLTNLDLQASHADDLSPLAGLTNLESLTIQNVNGIIPVLPNKFLKTLTIENSKNIDLASLENFPALEKLVLVNTRYRNLPPLGSTRIDLIGQSKPR